MSTPDRGRRRPRRLASDEAHAWARNLRLNKNVEAKLLLMMLALYVDSNGCAFVGIPTLAEDAELSAQTIRRRLAWLEEIGAIARVPQWIDSGGRRNGDENGKRTSDLIMFLYGADPDIIERRACGEVCAPVSPIYQIGLNRADADVSDSQDGQECGDAAGVDSDVSRAPISPSSQQGLQTGVLQGGEGVAAPNAVSPIQQIGLNPSFSPSSQRGLNPVSPTPALRQPYHCGRG